MEKKNNLEEYLKIDAKLNMALQALNQLNKERDELLKIAETVEELDSEMLEVLNASYHTYELLSDYILKLKAQASEIKNKK